MARTAVSVLVLGACVGAAQSASDATNVELQKTIAELQQMIESQGAEIGALKGELDGDRRRLKASIFGDKPGTRAYTATESMNMTLDHMWMLICGFMVMFMQAGFAMVEGGCVRFKNVQNIMLKNLTDVCVGTIGWWCFGWSLAFSGPWRDDNGVQKKNNWFGWENLAGHDFIEGRADTQQEPTTKIVNWYFQWAFAATAATIVSGGVAERVNFAGYSIFSFIMTAWIYPVVVGCTWGGGWLKHDNRTGFHDFAGSGIVHMTGGVGALVGAIIAGPRAGRWEGLGAGTRVSSTPERFNFHSMPLIVLGTFILWFGWYGFNCGSTLAMHNLETGMLAAVVAMNTTIAAATGGLVVFILRLALTRKCDAAGFCNGILAGLVSITAGCANMEFGYGFLTAAIGGIVYQMASSTLRACKIDDVVDAFAVHGACGCWGVLAAAFFDWGESTKYVHAGNGFRCLPDPDLGPGATNCDGKHNHLWKDLVAANFVEVACILAWVGGHCAVIFGILKACKLLTPSSDVQEQGFDWTYHSPRRAYELGDLPKTSM